MRPWAENWSATIWEEGNLVPWMMRTIFGNRIVDLSVTCGVVLCPGLPTHLRKDLYSPTPTQGGVPKCVDLAEVGPAVKIEVDHDPNFHHPCPELSNPCHGPCPCLFHRPCLSLLLCPCLFHQKIHFHLRKGANTNNLVQSTCTHHPNCKLLVDGRWGWRTALVGLGLSPFLGRTLFQGLWALEAQLVGVTKLALLRALVRHLRSPRQLGLPHWRSHHGRGSLRRNTPSLTPKNSSSCPSSGVTGVWLFLGVQLLPLASGANVPFPCGIPFPSATFSFPCGHLCPIVR